MSTRKQDIEYEFEDLRRNVDPLPDNVLEGMPDEQDALDDPDGGDGGDGSGDDEEMVPLSEVNRRLDKVRRESDRNIETAKEEAGQEIGKLSKRLDDRDLKDETETLAGEHEANVGRINTAIEVAMEAGESKEVTRLTIELAELTATNVTKREALKRKADEHDDPDDLHKRAEPAVIPRAKDWLAEQDWWDEPDNAHVKRYVNRLDKSLQEKGYSPHDDDFYEQLEEAVEKKYPGVILHTMDDPIDRGGDDEGDEFSDIPTKRSASKKKARRSARRSPVAGQDAGGSGGKQRNRQRGKTLNRNQIANMRMFGMDPDNKDHVEAYLAEVK